MRKSAQAATASSKRFRAEGRNTARRERAIQRKIDRTDKKARAAKKKPHAMQAGARICPAPPLPGQHLEKPGREADLDLQPMYDAPHYQGSEKLLDMAALVTGGDSGIGRAVAVLFAREGADVAIAYLDEHDDAEETRRAVENEGRRCILLPGDVADAKYCKAAVAKTVKAFGKLDILVNNAAFQEHVNAFEDLTDEHFDQTLKTNLYGYFYMAKAAVPELKKGSAIVMTGSVTGLLGNKDLLDYSMTKGGIHAFARHPSRPARHPRQRSGAWTGLDAAQPGGQIKGANCKVRQRHTDEAAGTTGGDCARLRISRGAELLKLHHRRSPADHWRLFGRLRRDDFRSM
jgi:NADP-dependent 3-hydroxy acid dehydrogenase YdfG